MLISKKNRREVYKYLFKGEITSIPGSLTSRNGLFWYVLGKGYSSHTPVKGMPAASQPTSVKKLGPELIMFPAALGHNMLEAASPDYSVILAYQKHCHMLAMIATYQSRAFLLLHIWPLSDLLVAELMSRLCDPCAVGRVWLHTSCKKNIYTCHKAFDVLHAAILDVLAMIATHQERALLLLAY